MYFLPSSHSIFFKTISGPNSHELKPSGTMQADCRALNPKHQNHLAHFPWLSKSLLHFLFQNRRRESHSKELLFTFSPFSMISGNTAACRIACPMSHAISMSMEVHNEGRVSLAAPQRLSSLNAQVGQAGLITAGSSANTITPLFGFSSCSSIRMALSRRPPQYSPSWIHFSRADFPCSLWTVW